MADEPFLNGQGGLDELGIASVAVDYRTKDFPKVWTIGEGEFNGLHERQGGRTWVQDSGGNWRVTVIYEGLVKETGLETFEVLPTRSEEPIESHPYLQELKDKYGGYLDSEGKLKFPEFLPDGPGTIDPTLGLVGPGRNGQAREPNKMFGWDSYFSKSTIVEHRLTRTEFPQEIYDLDGTIREEIPADYIQTPPERNWLINVENIRELVKIGGSSTGEIIFEVTIRYVLSRRGGWPPMHLLIEDLQ